MNWSLIINPLITTDYMKRLALFLDEVRKRAIVYPAKENIFRAFELTPFDSVKVVILGQDPYHDGNADGLAFSCAKRISPSLLQILKSLNVKIGNPGIDPFKPFSLEGWAKQGVLLLNAALTVEESFPLSHEEKWRTFTINVLASLIKDKKPKVIIGWGSFAKRLIENAYFIAMEKGGSYGIGHLQIYTEHPAAASHQGRDWEHKDWHIRTNSYLINNGMHPIDWLHFH